MQVNWTKENDRKLVLDVIIPIGCEASVVLPFTSVRVSVSDKLISDAGPIILSSGKYRLVAEIDK